MFTIPASFIGNFKRGDNINYNLQILKTLYKCYNELLPNEQQYLRKPIFLTIMSIIEVILYDFDMRIKYFTKEGVPNLPWSFIDYIRNKKYDSLSKYIVCAKKHGFFDTVHENFYDDLDKLRLVRNRIHIQNEENNFPPNENDAFSSNNLYLAECALEVVLRTMHSKYSRPQSSQGHVKDLCIPWDARYTEIK